MDLLRRQWVHIMSAIIVLVYFVLMVFLNLAFYRYAPRSTRLQDLGHEILPEIPREYEWCLDSPLTVLYVLAAIVLLGSLQSCWSIKLYLVERPFIVNMVRRFGVLYAMGHVLRALSYLSTSVPGGSWRCMQPDLVEKGRPSLAQAFYRAASVEENCGDLMFSGHLLLVRLCSLAD